MKLFFWIRWAWRDLKLRWRQVLTIAVIIALGTGIFAGLGGQESWRIESKDLSYSYLDFHDLRIRMAAGSMVDKDLAVQSLKEIEGVKSVDPRIIADILVDASNRDDKILVRGRLVGVNPREGGPKVDRIHIFEGEFWSEGSTDEAVLDMKFANYHGLEIGDNITLIGGRQLSVTGLGVSPEYFQIIPEHTGFSVQGEKNLAIIYVPLPIVWETQGQSGKINELRIVFEEGSNPDSVRGKIEQRMASIFPDTGISISRGDEDPVHVLLYTDAEEDQEMLNLIAFFFLLGAALAAFNLAGRIVESQRRQIGIGMAMGTPRRLLAFRPLLVGLQIALIGTLLGFPLGFLFTRLFGYIMTEFVPMPLYAGSLIDPKTFILAALLGIAMPVTATLLPVLKAIRSVPLDALHGHLAAKNSGLNRLLKGKSLTGRTFSRMPVKNVLRSPKRTILTVVAVAVSIALLFLFLGLLDTFRSTLDQVGNAMVHKNPDRVMITLNRVYGTDHEIINELSEIKSDDKKSLFKIAEPSLNTGGVLIGDKKEIGIMIEFIPPESEIWEPNMLSGSWEDTILESGIVISQKASEDLGADIGDTIVLEHPYREGPFSFRNEQTSLIVAGIHDSPVRGLAYLNMDDAGIMGMEDICNTLIVVPEEGISLDQIRTVLFDLPGVMAVDPVSEIIEAFDELLNLFISVMRVMQLVVLIIAFLIAFNSTSINLDDRIREVATMFAYGVKPRTVLWIQIGENAILGFIGTLLGGITGWIILNQMMAARMEVMLEEIQLLVSISPLSLVLAVLLGIGVVALTPVISLRKLKKIDIPSTLRVME